MFFSDLFRVIIIKLGALENSMNILLPMVKQLIVHFRLSKVSHMEGVPKLPVDSDENLEEFERFLDTNTNFEYMVNTLSISGGTTVSQISRRTLERIITNNYARNFNGRKNTEEIFQDS
ncbi:hypothetical protein DMN91_000005 [Ooceraea biroi]|uniref:Uncharacterized protein n=1 Tax=Ooceraea biroi TaxID=2015173 RepID=A0A3L8E111_OOCBI|nr:hypothetical protein DMN91_000005 [Ooceraea biroi]